jgi:glycerol-3-phosphate dehydrogenase
VALCEADPSLARRITGAEGYVRAEVVYAVTHEGALHLDDVMMRRTRMVYEYPDAADAALEEVADLVAAAAGWDAGRRAHEVSSYRDRAAAVRDAALETTDRDAARVRGRAVPSRRSGSRHGVEPAAPGMLPY